MLYEPPKTKQYIIIGAVAIVLIVLAMAVFSILHKNKTTQTPGDNTAVQEKLQQDNIQKEFEKLDEINKSENSNAPAPTSVDIQTELKKLNDTKPNSNTIPPAKEDVQKQLDLLNKVK